MGEEGQQTFCMRVMTQTMALQLILDKNICSGSYETASLAPTVYCSPIIFNWHPVKSRAAPACTSAQLIINHWPCDYPYMLIKREIHFIMFHLVIYAPSFSFKFIFIPLQPS